MMLRLQYRVGMRSSEEIFASIRAYGMSQEDIFVSTTTNIMKGGKDVIILSKSEKGRGFIAWLALKYDQAEDFKLTDFS